MLSISAICDARSVPMEMPDVAPPGVDGRAAGAAAEPAGDGVAGTAGPGALACAGAGGGAGVDAATEAAGVDGGAFEVEAALAGAGLGYTNALKTRATSST